MVSVKVTSVPPTVRLIQICYVRHWKFSQKAVGSFQFSSLLIHKKAYFTLPGHSHPGSCNRHLVQPRARFRIKVSMWRRCKACVTAGGEKFQQFLWGNTQLLRIPEWKIIRFSSRVAKRHNWTWIINPTTIHLYFLFRIMSLTNSLTFDHRILDHPLWISVIQKINNAFIRSVRIITYIWKSVYCTTTIWDVKYENKTKLNWNRQELKKWTYLHSRYLGKKVKKKR
jgi:hypothetical protein